MNINILRQSVSNTIFRFEMEAELNLEIMMSSMGSFLSRQAIAQRQK